MRKQVHTEYRGYRNPGIRLKEPLLPGVSGHTSEAEMPLLYAYHIFDKAHLIMLTEEGLIPRQDGVLMLKELRNMEAQGITKVRLEVGGGMHSGEHYLIRRLGEEVGGRIHLGRSSGDLGAVGRRIRLRDRLIELMQRLNDFRTVVLHVAERHLDTVMPGYTQSQHSQPETLGHQLLAWASALERDYQRADTAYQRTNQSPAGAGVMTGSDFLLNRQRTADLLGFDNVIKNTVDACLNDDYILDIFLAVISVNLNLSKWASDLNFWFTSEVGFVDIPDRFCGTSSIMMQKKNPYVLGFVRGAVAESMGGLVTACAVQKGCTGDPSQENRYMHEALSRSFDLAEQDLGWFVDLLPAVEIKKERMREMARSYWAQASDIAGALVRENGLPWRTAHQIVGILVRISYERGLKPADVTSELLDEAAVEYMGEQVRLSKEALERALDPWESINRRILYGGPAPEECRRRFPDYYVQLQAGREGLEGKRDRLKTAANKLERVIDSLLSK